MSSSYIYLDGSIGFQKKQCMMSSPMVMHSIVSSILVLFMIKGDIYCEVVCCPCLHGQTSAELA